MTLCMHISEEEKTDLIEASTRVITQTGTQRWGLSWCWQVLSHSHWSKDQIRGPTTQCWYELYRNGHHWTHLAHVMHRKDVKPNDFLQNRNCFHIIEGVLDIDVLKNIVIMIFRQYETCIHVTSFLFYLAYGAQATWDKRMPRQKMLSSQRVAHCHNLNSKENETIQWKATQQPQVRSPW